MAFAWEVTRVVWLLRNALMASNTALKPDQLQDGTESQGGHYGRAMELSVG
jgi:hypothetical protein